ncbi:hypothetical protein AB0C02_27920 [Micromonospora sp. NPDC048999]
MIRQHVGGLLPLVTVSRIRHLAGGQTFRLWIVWFRIALTVEVGL